MQKELITLESFTYVIQEEVRQSLEQLDTLQKHCAFRTITRTEVLNAWVWYDKRAFGLTGCPSLEYPSLTTTIDGGPFPELRHPSLPGDTTYFNIGPNGWVLFRYPFVPTADRTSNKYLKDLLSQTERIV